MTYYVVIISILVVILGLLTWAIWKTNGKVTLIKLDDLIKSDDKDKVKKDKGK